MTMFVQHVGAGDSLFVTTKLLSFVSMSGLFSKLGAEGSSCFPDNSGLGDDKGDM